jgi:hypothetical protein
LCLVGHPRNYIRLQNPRGHSPGGGLELGGISPEYISYQPSEGVSLGALRVIVHGVETSRGNPGGQPASRGSLPKTTVSGSPALYTVKDPQEHPPGPTCMSGESPQVDRFRVLGTIYGFQTSRANFGPTWTLGESPKSTVSVSSEYIRIKTSGCALGGSPGLGGVSPSSPCPYPQNYIRFKDPKG